MSQKSTSDLIPSLRRNVHANDLIGLSLVVIILVALFVLPEALKRTLAFSYVDPTPLTAITAHFVHLTWGHLAANLFGLVVLGGTGYVLAVLGGHRQLFAVLFTTYLLVFPPVLSMLNLAVPRTAIAYGFSGVNMALAGLLPLVLIEYAGRRIHGGIETGHAPGLFFLVMTLAALIAIPPQPITLGVAAVSGLLTVVYGWQMIQSIRSQPEKRRTGTNDRPDLGGWVELGVFGAIVAIGYPLIGYPTDPVFADQVINIYVHTLGYALAFIGGYIGLEIGLFE